MKEMAAAPSHRRPLARDEVLRRLREAAVSLATSPKHEDQWVAERLFHMIDEGIAFEATCELAPGWWDGRREAIIERALLTLRREHYSGLTQRGFSRALEHDLTCYKATRWSRDRDSGRPDDRRIGLLYDLLRAGCPETAASIRKRISGLSG